MLNADEGKVDDVELLIRGKKEELLFCIVFLSTRSYMMIISFDKCHSWNNMAGVEGFFRSLLLSCELMYADRLVRAGVLFVGGRETYG